MKFSDNFNIFSITSMILFYFNKEFHSWMSFDSDMTDYKTTHKQLKARKANDIIIQMKKLQNFNYQQLKKTKLIIKVQINKHKQNIIYEVNDWVWLSFRNFKTIRLCKDLKDKQLNFYQITVKVSIFYHLHLSVSMKHLHSMFSSKLLQLYSENSLSEQHSKSLRSIIIKDDEHWEINNILNFRCYQDWIQYKVKWTNLDRNNKLDWSSSWVSSWHFELELRSSRVAHIFNLIWVRLLIFSTWRDSIRLKIESIQLNSSRTQAWRQES